MLLTSLFLIIKIISLSEMSVCTKLVLFPHCPVSDTLTAGQRWMRVMCSCDLRGNQIPPTHPNRHDIHADSTRPHTYTRLKKWSHEGRTVGNEISGWGLPVRKPSERAEEHSTNSSVQYFLTVQVSPWINFRGIKSSVISKPSDVQCLVFSFVTCNTSSAPADFCFDSSRQLSAAAGYQICV